ncbi:unnamed protein product [Boreogadus saida]
MKAKTKGLEWRQIMSPYLPAPCTFKPFLRQYQTSVEHGGNSFSFTARFFSSVASCHVIIKLSRRMSAPNTCHQQAGRKGVVQKGRGCRGPKGMVGEGIILVSWVRGLEGELGEGVWRGSWFSREEMQRCSIRPPTLSLTDPTHPSTPSLTLQDSLTNLPSVPLTQLDTPFRPPPTHPSPPYLHQLPLNTSPLDPSTHLPPPDPSPTSPFQTPTPLPLHDHSQLPSTPLPNLPSRPPHPPPPPDPIHPPPPPDPSPSSPSRPSPNYQYDARPPIPLWTHDTPSPFGNHPPTNTTKK